MTRSGIDLTALDPDVRPQDDLFAHVNGRWLAALPADVLREGDYFHFSLPESGIEPLLRALIEGEAGILSLSIERAGLHDAFVHIAGEAAAAEMSLGPTEDAG